MGRPKAVRSAVTPSRIQGARKHWRLTQKQLAERVDVSVETIKRYECGRTGVPRNMLCRLGEVLDIKPEYLAGETDEKGGGKKMTQLGCPLKIAAGPNTYTRSALCEEDRCAWWCADKHMCAIKALALIDAKETTADEDSNSSDTNI